MNESRQSPGSDPGARTSIELEEALTDALKGLWSDAWRRDQPTAEQLRIFRRRVESALYSATGQELWLTTRFERR